MKYIVISIVSFLIGYNFKYIHMCIIKFIIKLKYREKKYFEEFKIKYDDDFYDYKFNKNDFDK